MQARAHRGFTLVELLVVISIITVLIAILLPAVGMVRETARRTDCSHRIRQLAMGILTYETTHKAFPPGESHGSLARDPAHWPTGNTSGTPGTCDFQRRIGMWANFIYPQLEMQNYYDQFEFAATPQYSSERNRYEMQRVVPMFLCPSDPYRELTCGWGSGGEESEPQNQARIMHYFAVGGSSFKDAGPSSDPFCNKSNGVFYVDSNTRLTEIRDGASSTALLCETWGRVWPREFPDPDPVPGYPATRKSRGMNGQAIVYFDYGPNVDKPDILPSRHKINPMENRGVVGRPRSFHPGGVNVAFVDGAVTFVSDTINSYPDPLIEQQSAGTNDLKPRIFQHIASINGAEVVNPKHLNNR